MQEILMILLVAILAVGPNKIVEFGKSLGNVSRNLKRASTDFTSSLNKEIEIEEKARKTNTTPSVPPEKKP